MMSENSSFHRFMSLEINISKRRKWVVLLAFVTYMLYNVGGLALRLFSKGISPIYRINIAGEILSARSPNAIITIVGSLILAVEGFQWLMVRQQQDFYESMPISRNAHFFGVALNSALILFSSHLLASLAGMAVAACGGALTAKVASIAIMAVVRDFCLFAAVFSVSMLAVMLTGNLIVSIIASVVLLSCERALSIILGECESIIPTYSGDPLVGCDVFSPVSTAMASMDYAVPRNLICAANCFALSYVFYRLKKSEDVGKTVPLKAVRIIIKFLICFLLSLFVGLIFELNSGIIAGTAAIMVSSVIMGGIMEAIYHIDISKVFKGMGITAASFLTATAVLLGCRYDFFGYSKWIPETSKVESAYITSDEGSQAFDSGYSAKYMKLKNIDRINELLRIGEKATVKATDDKGLTVPEHYMYVTISYRMKSGRIISRKVIIPPKAAPLMNAIIKSKEFREGYFKVFHDKDIIKDQKIVSIGYTGDDANEYTRFASSGDIYDELKAAYIKDLENVDYDTLCKKMLFGEIDIEISSGEPGSSGGPGSSGDHVFWPVYQSFTNTIEVLKKNDIYVAPDIDNSNESHSGYYVWPDSGDRY